MLISSKNWGKKSKKKKELRKVIYNWNSIHNNDFIFLKWILIYDIII